MDGKKSGLAILMGIGKPKPGGDDEPSSPDLSSEDDEDDGAFSDACDEVFDAIESKDSKAFGSALKAAIKAAS